jgi:hypothetical protein
MGNCCAAFAAGVNINILNAVNVIVAINLMKDVE